MGIKRVLIVFLGVSMFISVCASSGALAAIDMQIYPGFIFKGTDDKFSYGRASSGYLNGYLSNADQSNWAWLIAPIERRRPNAYQIDVSIDVFNPWIGNPDT